QDEQRNDEAGDSDEDENALTLIRHQVDVAQRLRDPHERGHAGANHQERTERGAENIAADGPHPIYASPLATERQCAGPPMPVNGAPMLYLPPFYPLFDPATKWLGQGKAFEYAQQNVNLDRVSRRPQAPARKVFVSSQGVDLGGSACKRFRHARPRPSSGCLSPFVMPAGRKTRPFTSLREYPRISSRNRR